MKKLLLVGLMLTYVGAFAQQSQDSRTRALSRINPDLLKLSKKVEQFSNNVDNGGPVNRRNITVASTPHHSDSRAMTNEAVIGETYYDLQTNNSISDRIVRNADGTISVVWTYAPDGTSGYPDRGTGYNYFDGTSWMPWPDARIESERAGFTNIGVTGTGKEVVIAHGIQSSGPSKGMIQTSRPEKGTGGWATNDAILGEFPNDTIDLWPKMAIGGPGDSSIHAIWRGGSGSVAYYGQTGPIFYSRSQTDGNSWDIKQSVIAEIDSNYYLGFSADNYSIDAKGNVVAIVASNVGQDVVLVKSTDNGDTWTKTIVSGFPIFKFNSATMSTDTNADSTPDTLWSGVGDATVLIDNNDSVHVFFTMVRTVGSVGSYVYYPFSSQIFYWNERYGPDSIKAIAYAPDLDNDGFISVPPNNTSCPDAFPFGGYGLTKLVENPSAAIDDNNNIYLSYHTIDELSEPSTVEVNSDKVFKHPYVIKTTDGGETWTDYNVAFDITLATIGSDAHEKEGAFAALARRVDNQVHMVYQRDYFPGVSLATANSCEALMNSVTYPNEIVYVAIDTTLTIGVRELTAKPENVILSPAYPNPASEYAKFNVSLKNAANVQVQVTDILGQSVYTENKGRLSTGVHSITLNTAYLSSGVYFYSIIADGEKATGKMIVE